VTGYHSVRPYTRKDGTRVRGHSRRNPSPAGAGAWAGLLVFLLLLALLHAAADHHAAAHSVRAPSHQEARIAHDGH
jgi:hypothetical protein